MRAMEMCDVMGMDGEGRESWGWDGGKLTERGWGCWGAVLVTRTNGNDEYLRLPCPPVAAWKARAAPGLGALACRSGRHMRRVRLTSAGTGRESHRELHRHHTEQMSQPRPAPQSALRNIPKVVVRPAWENTVACSYLPKVCSFWWRFVAACTVSEPNSKPGHRLLHCTPLLVPAAESSPAPCLSA
jgi:hypothetical protein